MHSDIDFLSLALEEAQKAAQKGEVPVGAIIVLDNTVIAKAHNLKETLKDTTAHAEILAIKEAQKAMNAWRLSDCRMYSTLEPCPMCMGAILHSRLSKVIFAAKDLKWGAAGTMVDLNDVGFNHKVECQYEPLSEAEAILKTFFKELRNPKGIW